MKNLAIFGVKFVVIFIFYFSDSRPLRNALPHSPETPSWTDNFLCKFSAMLSAVYGSHPKQFWTRVTRICWYAMPPPPGSGSLDISLRKALALDVFTPVVLENGFAPPQKIYGIATPPRS
jgi:hypothetical protein